MTSPRPKRPLDPKAVAAADRALYAAHPELKGRKLTSGPVDAAYRDAWRKAYADAGGAVQDDPGKRVGAVMTQCPLDPNDVPRTYGKAIKIEGDAAFRLQTIAALNEIEDTASGRALLRDIDGSGKTITISETSSGNEVVGFTKDGHQNADGSTGKGSDSRVNFNPARTRIGSADWETRPPAIGLGHELVHAAHLAKGEASFTKVQNDKRPDPSNPKAYQRQIEEEVRTTGIPPYDKEPYSENTMRREWDPKQPPRPWY